MIRITFLGTVAARPTPNRNVSSVVVERNGELLMFDCGEGTQRQMMRYDAGWDIRDIFFSHLHGDHFLGVTGLLWSMALQERTEPIHLWTARGTERLLTEAVTLGGMEHPFEVVIRGVSPGDTLMRDGYDVICFRTQHKGPSLGYALVEDPRAGPFNSLRARALRVPDGRLWAQLQQGIPVQVEGRMIRPEDVAGPPQRGRKVVYTGDTRPCASVQEAATAADVLIHEATFGSDDAVRARATGHSTAAEAARIARGAGVRALLLTHVSARQGDNVRVLEQEARRLFPAARVAYDGLSFDVAHRPQPEESRDSIEPR